MIICNVGSKMVKECRVSRSRSAAVSKIYTYINYDYEDEEDNEGQNNIKLQGEQSRKKCDI